MDLTIYDNAEEKGFDFWFNLDCGVSVVVTISDKDAMKMIDIIQDKLIARV